MKKYFNLYTLSVFLLLILTASCCFQNRTETRKISEVTQYHREFDSVVLLPSTENNVDVGIRCTAFFVSGKYLVTARHCLVDADNFALILKNADPDIQDRLIDAIVKQMVSKQVEFDFIYKNDFFKNKAGERKMRKAKLVYMTSANLLKGPGPATGNDIAILEVSNSSDYSKVWLPIAKQSPKIGEEVHYIGMPMRNVWLYVKGYFGGLEYDNLTGKPRAYISNITLVPGGSGSPLINKNGEVIGINSSVQKYPILDTPGDLFVGTQMVPFGLSLMLKDLKTHLDKFGKIHYKK